MEKETARFIGLLSPKELIENRTPVRVVNNQGKELTSGSPLTGVNENKVAAIINCGPTGGTLVYHEAIVILDIGGSGAQEKGQNRKS